MKSAPIDCQRTKFYQNNSFFFFWTRNRIIRFHCDKSEWLSCQQKKLSWQIDTILQWEWQYICMHASVFNTQNRWELYNFFEGQFILQLLFFCVMCGCGLIFLFFCFLLRLRDRRKMHWKIDAHFLYKFMHFWRSNWSFQSRLVVGLLLFLCNVFLSSQFLVQVHMRTERFSYLRHNCNENEFFYCSLLEIKAKAHAQVHATKTSNWSYDSFRCIV